MQLVAGSVIKQLTLPSLTVMVPVGVPVPGGVTATMAVTAIGAPTSDGFGVNVALMVERGAGQVAVKVTLCPNTLGVPEVASAVLELALLTVCATPGEVLPLKLASPA